MRNSDTVLPSSCPRTLYGTFLRTGTKSCVSTFARTTRDLLSTNQLPPYPVLLVDVVRDVLIAADIFWLRAPSHTKVTYQIREVAPEFEDFTFLRKPVLLVTVPFLPIFPRSSMILLSRLPEAGGMSPALPIRPTFPSIPPTNVNLGQQLLCVRPDKCEMTIPTSNRSSWSLRQVCCDVSSFVTKG